jgi:hypothetical protein
VIVPFVAPSVQPTVAGVGGAGASVVSGSEGRLVVGPIPAVPDELVVVVPVGSERPDGLALIDAVVRLVEDLI